MKIRSKEIDKEWQICTLVANFKKYILSGNISHLVTSTNHFPAKTSKKAHKVEDKINSYTMKEGRLLQQNIP